MDKDTKSQLLTIPNLMSLFRLLLIPFIVWSYFALKQPYVALGLIVLSALTDILDGIVARKCNMVSDFGKIFDPIADKLTQGTIIICLILKYPLMISLIVAFVIKEVTMGIMGLITVKRYGEINSAKWYGKANTVLLYVVMGLLILFPQMNEVLVNVLIIICHVFELFALLMYVRFYRKVWKENKRKNEQ